MAWTHATERRLHHSSPKKRRLAVSLIGDTSGPLVKWSSSRVGSWAISGSARDRNAFASSLAPMNISVNQNSSVRIGVHIADTRAANACPALSQSSFSTNASLSLRVPPTVRLSP